MQATVESRRIACRCLQTKRGTICYRMSVSRCPVARAMAVFVFYSLSHPELPIIVGRQVFPTTPKINAKSTHTNLAGPRNTRVGSPEKSKINPKFVPRPLSEIAKDGDKIIEQFSTTEGIHNCKGRGTNYRKVVGNGRIPQLLRTGTKL